jgi:hypothetical protein
MRSNQEMEASMRKPSSCSMIRVLGSAVLILAATCWAQERPAIADQIAKVYGVDSWSQIDAVRYTWNGEITGLFKVSRTWTWQPKTGMVTYEGPDKAGKAVKVTYNSNQLSTQPDAVKNEVEPGFINDQYWAFFPFHAVWDSSATVTDQEMKKLPIGAGSATLVSVKYPAEAGGFTPGDTWDLYVGKDNRVVQFVYHRGGSQKPSLVTATWAGYKKAGPLLFSTDHRGNADGKPLHIFLSDVAVKVSGSDQWVNAK